MAKDANNKPVPSNNTDNTISTPVSDQQKVPPLRIVLNTSGNQKSSSTAVAVTATNQQQQQQQNQELKKDSKSDNSSKSVGGKVRIKLGTNKQASSKTSNSSSSLSNETSSSSSSVNRSSNTDEAQKVKSSDKQDTKEEINVNYSHLRRLTRRSQRTVQTVSNEDEESISSMTSTDENQNTTNSTSDNNNASQDTVVSNSASQSSTSTVTTTATKTTVESCSNVETPRRYKRRKGETTEYQLTEHDGPFGLQNYKLPNQNSFELFKNIRKQVDKKLKDLSSIHPKTPYGFRDYMITRGAYLLDGNKLGNGTNLFINENGDIHSAPPITTKLHALRHNKINYSIPDRAKVPQCLPVNSPLYNLFIEQEKERHRMRMQHLKEREKLTLATEQEIVRVHNQAAMAAANQLEPFSVCTMLKHQEIYNYMDANGVTILAAEDQQQEDQATKESETRTRRGQPQPAQSQPQPAQPQPQSQQFEQVSPPSSPKKSSSVVEDQPSTQSDTKPKDNSHSPPAANETTRVDDSQKNDDVTKPSDSADGKINMSSEAKRDDSKDEDKTNIKSEDKKSNDSSGEVKVDAANGDVKMEVDEKETPTDMETSTTTDTQESDDSKTTVPDEHGDSARPNVTVKVEPTIEAQTDISNPKKEDSADDTGEKGTNSQDEVSAVLPDNTADQQAASTKQDVSDQSANQQESTTEQPIMSDDDRKAYNRAVFLTQLQQIDDKWERIRNEMLIRHRNEAESLHAVQKLEWEWKTKEIGVCDVRTTPVIDNSFVPKLTIYSQDY